MLIQLFLHFHKTICTDHAEIVSSRLILLTCIQNLCFIVKSSWTWLETVLLDFGLDYLLWYSGICLVEGTSYWCATFRSDKDSTFNPVPSVLEWFCLQERANMKYELRVTNKGKTGSFSLNWISQKIKGGPQVLLCCGDWWRTRVW